jgi:hypothetical protein
MDPFNMNVTLMHKTLEIERASQFGHPSWREATHPPEWHDERPSYWQRFVSLFRVQAMREATID